MKYFIYIALLIFSFQLVAQTESPKFNRTKWNELKGKIKYKKSPEQESGSSNNSSSSFDRASQERNIDSKNYREDRNRSYERDRDISKEEEGGLSWDLSGLNGVAKVLMIVLAVVLIAFIIYQIAFKNKSNQGGNSEIEEDLEEYDINTVQKSELELALEKAFTAEDYRKCVRIYFTFILKELSTNNYIYWERDKTNYDYLSEMSEKKEFHGFRNSVDVFEIIWYGKRDLNLEIYQQLEPEFKSYLKKITKSE